MITLTDEQKELFKKVQEIFEEDLVYAVGGCVRDIILGAEPKDYDFAIANPVEQIEASVKSSGRRAFLTGKRFGTIGCKVEVNGKQHMVEITQFRSEKYEEGSRKPTVEFVDDITADLARRDFTINAMAIRLDNLRLVDPFSGFYDLHQGVIRSVGDATERFKEDPLRILRAVRFVSRFGYVIDKETEWSLIRCVPKLLKISKERWVDEFDKILMGYYVYDALDCLWDYRIFNWTIPELGLQNDYDQNTPHHKWKLDYHTAQVVNGVPNDINMKWAALLHDVAKPFTRTEKMLPYIGKSSSDQILTKSQYIGHQILGAEMVRRIGQHLKWSNERIETVSNLVLNHMEEDSPLREFDNAAK